MLRPVAGLLNAHSQCSLQQLLVAWRNQAARHACVSAPALLPIQVARFDHSGEKLHFTIRPSTAVYVPVFSSDDERTTSRCYVLLAAIYHIGSTKFSGHYRTAFYSQGCVAYVTDDNVATRRALPADEPEIHQNSYVYLLARQE